MTTFSVSATYTDLYQLTMGQVYFLTGRHQNPASFDYFFRKIPFGGGYVVFAGLGTVLETLSDFTFSDEDLRYLRDLGLNARYIDYLKGFRFKGSVFAAREGEIVFPTEPILSVRGSILETQLAETVLLNLLNFQSLVATKAARMRVVAGERVLSDFGLRRAQGTGGYHATRASIVGGFNSTSNVKAAMDFGVPCVGTMAHSFIQDHDTELSAFRAFAEHRPDNCVLLVDTYDTLESGVPNAITVAKEMEARGQRLLGIRLDSGDLAYLARAARDQLDEAGLNYVTITASNQLDEYVIKSLLDQDAPIDIFGVGTNLVTAPPDAALDGVYKLAWSDDKPRIKLSENLKKMTLPDRKQVFRLIRNNSEFFGGDAIALEDEVNPGVMHHPFIPEKSMAIGDLRKEKLLGKVMAHGQLTGSGPSITEAAAYCRQRLAMLPAEYKRFEYPHIFKVGISEKLRGLRNELIQHYRKPS